MALGAAMLGATTGCERAEQTVEEVKQSAEQALDEVKQSAGELLGLAEQPNPEGEHKAQEGAAGENNEEQDKDDEKD
jgi:hypothetical protein